MKKIDQRGGARTPLRRLTSQQLMLAQIWKDNGGNWAVAEKLGVDRQAPINWRARGCVPLEMVGTVARKLKVSPYLLNYEGVLKYEGKGLSWKAYVAEYTDTKGGTINPKILTARQPKETPDDK